MAESYRNGTTATFTTTVSLRPVTPLGIVAATLEQLSNHLDGVDGFDPAMASQVRHACAIARGLEPYLSRCTTPESAALAALAKRTRKEDWARHAGAGTGWRLEAEMLSGHVEGQLLKFLVHLTGATRVLEIGMFTGYSALAMAEALPVDGRVVACEIDAAVSDFAQRCFSDSPDGAKISVRVGPAQDTLHQLAEARENFDLVFIDADKAGYVGYLRTVLDGDLLAEGGLICVDNTLMQGQPYTSDTSTTNGDAIATFNQVLADDDRVEQVLLPLRDGFTLVRRV